MVKSNNYGEQLSEQAVTLEI